jgi:ankyrin repeat protein
MAQARNRKTGSSFSVSTPFSSSSQHFPRSSSSASTTTTSVNSNTALDRDSKRPLRDAFTLLIQQDVETTIYLLKSGAVDLHQTDPRGATALHLAVRAGNVDLVNVLLHFDSVQSTLLNMQGEGGWTALHEALSRRNLELFRLLLKKGANPAVKNDFGDTPREMAQRLGIDHIDVDQVWFGKFVNTNDSCLYDYCFYVSLTNYLLFTYIWLY